MRTRRGISLVEILVSALLIILVVGVVARAFSAGLTFEEKSAKNRAVTAQRLWLEDRFTQLISGATLNGTSTYFVSPIPASASSPGLSSAKDNSLGAGSDSIVLTNASIPISARVLGAKTTTFEELNRQFGPVGGSTEVAISMTPVGDPKGQTGLFLRLQCPADGDKQQGGQEEILSPNIKGVRFQFNDGNQWQDTWDTTGSEKGKLPKLVKVRYQLLDETEEREILVRLPLTDAAAPSGTPNNSGTPGGPGAPGNPGGPGTPGAPTGGNQG